MTPPMLTVAVVGHSNTGKTSLLRTLLRDVTFGEVSDRPATTRDVSGTVLLVDGEPTIELYDTPGMEDSIGLLQCLESQRSGRAEHGVEVVERFLAGAEAAAGGRFAQEAKALRQVLKSDVALYVIDARDRPLPKYRDELAILSMCSRPVVPVLNFIAKPDAQTAAWRDQLARLNLHAVAEFDTVVVDEHSEQRLFEKMRTLLDGFRPTLDALIDDRQAQRERLIVASARLIADVLIDAAAVAMTVPADDEEQVRAATERLRELVRRREQQCVRDLLELHRFHPDDCEPDDLPLENGEWGLDLFNPDALKQFGIRAGSAAAAGAMAGLVIDVAAGGISLGAATATGAAIGAAISAGRSHGKRLLNLLRGRSELRCDAATIHLLQARQVALVRALLARGHAAQRRLQLDQKASGGAAGGGPRPHKLPPPLVKARSRPTWSSLTGNSAVEGTTQRVSIATAGANRDAARDELAELIERELRGK